MAQRYGQIATFQARKEFECSICKESIVPGNVYVLTTIVNRGYATKKSHEVCWLDEFYQRNRKLVAYNKNPTGLRVTRLHNLTKEQRQRRKVLQTYITTRDIPALKKAYEQHSTERVIKVMQTFSSRWEEFEQMGVNPKGYLWKDKKLDNYIATYDAKWLQFVFKEDLTLKEQVGALRRSLDDQYLPDWGDNGISSRPD